jgi:hypothetical protein
MDYVDPGASSYETRYRARVIDNLHRRAKAFASSSNQRCRPPFLRKAAAYFAKEST